MHNLNKKIIFVVLLLFIIIVAGIGLWYFLNQTRKLNTTEKNALDIQKSEIALQTYTAEHGMFTVKYPADWTPYKIKAEDVGMGGVNIYPAEAIPVYEKENFLGYDWSYNFLPFDQWNGKYPIISIGGEVMQYDSYTNRGQYNFKATPLYAAIRDYFKKYEALGALKNVQIEDVMVGAEPAIVAIFEDVPGKSKEFYMVKLAKGAITEKLPLTAYYFIQYIAPKEKYSQDIADALRASFNDDLGAAFASASASSQPSAVASSSQSQGHIWNVLFPGPFTHEVNWLEFDYKFTDPKGAEGLLTIQWDAKRIGDLDGRIQREGHVSFSGPVGKTYKDNIFDLGFRLDSFTKVPSSVIISNIGLYYLDPTIHKLGNVSKVTEVLPEKTPSQKSPAGESFGSLILK